MLKADLGGLKNTHVPEYLSLSLTHVYTGRLDPGRIYGYLLAIRI